MNEAAEVNVRIYAERNGIDLTTMPIYNHAEYRQKIKEHMASWGERPEYLKDYSLMTSGAAFDNNGDLILLNNRYQEECYIALMNLSTTKREVISFTYILNTKSWDDLVSLVDN